MREWMKKHRVEASKKMIAHEESNLKELGSALHQAETMLQKLKEEKERIIRLTERSKNRIKAYEKEIEKHESEQPK